VPGLVAQTTPGTGPDTERTPVTEPADRRPLVERLVTLLQTSTEVPAGSHEIKPGDERIRAAVRDVVAPMIEALGPDDVVFHPDGDLLARFGPPGDDGLLIQTYIVSQHGNEMEDPLSGRLEEGDEFGVTGKVVIGQGANQNKGPMASALAALEMRPDQLSRPVLLAVNTEGMSSHGGSRRIIDDLGARASRAILAFGTDLNVSIGNRGRVDIHIEVPGKSSHSSQPLLGINPLPRAAAVIEALASAPLPAAHPVLGPATVTPYQLRFEPVAPHTLPERGRMLVDRRLLPGEQPEEACESIRRHLAASLDFDVLVTQGVVMLPAEVPADDPVVAGLISDITSQGRACEPTYAKNTFDAGYGCHRGIPTVMFGPGRRSFGEAMIATEWVSVDDCRMAAVALSGAISRLCG
jgi:succinyl-diaminopimelate desuccinylase